MFWKYRKRPAPPPVEQERQFVEWLLRHGREFRFYRSVYAGNLEKFIDLSLHEIMQDLGEHPDQRSLKELYDDGCSRYGVEYLPLLDEAGGIRALGFSDPHLQLQVMRFQAKLLVFHYILRYKYRDTKFVRAEPITGTTEDLHFL